MRRNFAVDHAVVAGNIERRRMRSGMTVAALAARAQVTRQALYAVTSGARWMSLDMLFRIADALGVSPVALLRLRREG